VYVSVNYNQFREDTDNEITFNTGIIDTEDEYRLNAIEKVRADSLFDPVDTTYGFYDHFANSYTFTPEGPSVMDSGIVGIYGFNEDDKTIAKINIPLESENSVLESIFEDTTESMGTGSSGLQLSAPVCSTTDDNGPDFDKKGTISCDEFCFDISTEQRVFTCDGENCRLYESWYDDDGVIHSGLIDCLNHGFNFCKDGMCV